MAYNTTDTTGFNLDLSEIVEEAYERCGAEARTGYDMRTARRSLNLLLLDWANRGINMWTIESGTIPLVQGTQTYDLPLDTIDLIEYAVRTGTGTTQTDLTMSRTSVSDWAALPAKNATGRPIQLMVQRRTGANNSAGTPVPPRVHVWPIPDNSTYTFVYWRLRRMQDAGHGLNGQDIPFRFLPALTAGLAYFLSLKVPNAIMRRQELKADYDETWELAATEDRERATLRIVPRIG